MISAVTALLLAWISTSLLTPWVRRLAVTKGVVDQPGGRHVHEQTTPRLGGVAVIIGFFVPLAIFALVKTNAMQGFLEHRNLVLGLVLGSAVVGVVGAIDDVRSLGPWAKLAAQTAAAILAYAFGYRIEAVNVPLLGDIEMGFLALPVTVFWFLAITNAINLIDGLDGLASGIALFATISNFAIAYMNDSHVVVLLSASLGGSLIGFLRFNFNPAVIFLGDSGSMFLGFVLAATSVAGATTKSSTAIAILVPIIALGVPIMDTLLAMVRRTLAHQSIFAADRKHIHHRLLDLGFTHRRVVLLLYGMSIALATAAMAVAFRRSAFIGAALLIAGSMIFTVVVGLRKGSGVRDIPGDFRSSLVSSFAQLTTRTVASLEHVDTEVATRVRIGGSGPQSAEIEVRLLLREPQATEETESRLLVYDLSAGSCKRFLQVCISGELSMRDTEVADAVGSFVEACRDGVQRMSENASASTSFRIASAHVSGSDD